MKRIHLIFIVVSAMILLGALPGCTRGEGPAASYMPTLPADFPKPGDTAITEVRANGITVRLIVVKNSVEPVQFWDVKENKIGYADKRVITLDVCYETPDIGEWTLFGDDDMLRFGETISGGYAMNFNWQDEILPDEKRMGEKCAQYMFTFDPALEVSPPLTITFDRMFATPREGLSPCGELIKRVETNPRAQEAGLKIRCEDVPNARDDFTISVQDAAPVLADFNPFVVTEDQAQALMTEIQSAEVRGPWVFTLDATDSDGFLTGKGGE